MIKMLEKAWSMLVFWKPKNMEVVEPGRGLAEKKALVDNWDNGALHRLAEKFKRERRNGDIDDE